MKAEYIAHLGDDLMVVNAARVSFDKESEWEPEALCPTDEMGGKIPPYNRLSGKDAKLISYLAKHGHWTPFSHPQITMRETVPIFIARQRFKHMVGFTYNEVSRRYVDDEPTFFVPDVWRSRPEGSVKQGSGNGVVEKPSFLWVDYGSQGTYADFIELCTENYKHLLEQGVAPELARMVLPQSMYTSYYVTGSLSAWARAYKQRSDAHAQKEIQDLAAKWNDIIAPLYPESWKALTEG